MKRIEITSTTFVPPSAEGEEPKALFVGTIVDLDDKIANEILAAGRAKLADKGDKVRDTTKTHETALAERVNATPETLLANAIAVAVAAAVPAVIAAQADAAAKQVAAT